MRHIYRAGYACKRCGALLGAMARHNRVQRDLFDHRDHDRPVPLLPTVDRINAELGRECIRIASAARWTLPMTRAVQSHVDELIGCPRRIGLVSRGPPIRQLLLRVGCAEHR